METYPKFMMFPMTKISPHKDLLSVQMEHMLTELKLMGKFIDTIQQALLSSF